MFSVPRTQPLFGPIPRVSDWERPLFFPWAIAARHVPSQLDAAASESPPVVGERNHPDCAEYAEAAGIRRHSLRVAAPGPASRLNCCNTDSTVLYRLRPWHFPWRMTIVIYGRDIMTTDVATVTPTCTLYDAVELMLEKRVSGLPVLDDQRRLVGISSEFALLVLTYDKSASDDSVAKHMTRLVTSVEETDLLSDIADIFILNRFRRVPVTRNGKLVGIISRRDLMRAAHQNELSLACPEILVQQRASHAEEGAQM